jgi:hypothetical protein
MSHRFQHETLRFISVTKITHCVLEILIIRWSVFKFPVRMIQILIGMYWIFFRIIKICIWSWFRRICFCFCRLRGNWPLPGQRLDSRHLGIRTEARSVQIVFKRLWRFMKNENSAIKLAFAKFVCKKPFLNLNESLVKP